MPRKGLEVSYHRLSDEVPDIEDDDPLTLAEILAQADTSSSAETYRFADFTDYLIVGILQEYGITIPYIA